MAWNEPGGEKRNPWNRPQQSQNDLDDVLRNLQRRLSACSAAAGAAAAASAARRALRRGLATVLVLIGVVWIASGMYRVDAQERAVVLRFGKYERTVGPGYNWHLPWPIERKIIVNVSQQYSIPDDARMLTADTNLVEVRSAVQYTQPDPRKYLFKVKDVEDTLRQISESALREAVGQASLDRALAFDPAITDHARATLQRTLDTYDMGVRIISVTLQEVVVPEPVQDAQRDKRSKPTRTASAISRMPRATRTTSCRARAARPRSSCSMRRPIASRCSRSPRARRRDSIRCSSSTSMRPR